MTARRLDPRQQRTHTTVLAAARQVLRRDGVSGATFDAIAEAAGVARSTLYRNWGSLEELLDQAIGDITTVATPAEDGQPLDRLRAVVVNLADRLDHSEWGATLPAIVAAIDASPEFADRYRNFVDGRRREVRRLVRAAITSGALRGDTDADDLIDALVGPLFYRRLVRRVPTSRRWTDAHIDAVLARLGPSNRT